MRGLKNKTAIVTGGGQGIGRAIVLRLAEEGCNIALFDLKPDVAEETAKAAKGAEVRVYAADVSDRAAVDAAVVKVGNVILGRCGFWSTMPAGTNPRRSSRRTENFGAKIIQINLYGPLNMHHAVCPGMVERGGGRVVNIASDAARVGTSDEAVYWACKGGLIAFTKSLARELARKNVLLNAVCPGPTNTPMMQTVLGTGEQAVKWKEAMVRGIPLKRMGEPGRLPGHRRVPRLRRRRLHHRSDDRRFRPA